MSVDRFEIFEGQPPLLPGSCIICGSANDSRSFIDFGVQVKKYGRIYFCNECFNDCAETVGWTSPKTFDEMMDTVESYSTQIGNLKEENAKLRNLVSTRISELRDDLVELTRESNPVKRTVGRPKKSESGTAKQNPS